MEPVEKNLVTAILVIGLLGWISSLLLCRPSGRTKAARLAPRPFLLLASSLPVVVLLATWPAAGPWFTKGHGLGIGFLLGGVGALLSAWTLRGASAPMDPDRSGTRAAAMVTTPCFLAIACGAVAVRFWRDSVIDVLASLAIGWFVVTATLLVGTLFATEEKAPQAERGSQPVTLPFALSMIGGLAFVMLMSMLALLGEFRGMLDLTPTHTVHWSVFALLVAASVPLAILIGGLPAPFFVGIAARLGLTPLLSRLSGSRLATDVDPKAGARVWRAIASLFLVSLAGWLLALRVQDEDVQERLAWHLHQLIGLGLAGGLLAWWVIASQTRQEAKSSPSAPGWHGEIAALLLVVGVMAASQTLEGFGVALLLLMAWPAIGLAAAGAIEETMGASPQKTGEPAPGRKPVGKTAERLLNLMLFGVAITLYRVFSARFHDDMRSASLTDHYALFAILLGALLPYLLARYLLRGAADSGVTPGAVAYRLVVTGALVLAIPTLVIALWGAKCALALMIGLALGVVVAEKYTISIFPLPGEPDAQTAAPSRTSVPGLLPGLLACAVCLALMQWTGHVLPLSQLERVQRVHVIEGVTALLIVLGLLSEWSVRRGGSSRSAQPKAGAAAQGGAGQ